MIGPSIGRGTMTNDLTSRGSENFLLTWLGCMAALAMSCAVATGCGDFSRVERASIGGNVTLDGQPVESGTIRLTSLEEKGGPSAGGDIVGGKYFVAHDKGPSLGRHRVEVYIPYKTGRRIVSPMGGAAAVVGPMAEPGQPAVDPNQPGTVDEWSDKAPPKYNRESILEVNIESGENTYHVQMESK